MYQTFSGLLRLWRDSESDGSETECGGEERSVRFLTRSRLGSGFTLIACLNAAHLGPTQIGGNVSWVHFCWIVGIHEGRRDTAVMLITATL